MTSGEQAFNLKVGDHVRPSSYYACRPPCEVTKVGTHPVLGFWFVARYPDGGAVRQYPECKGSLEQRFDPVALTPEEVERDWVEDVIEEMRR